MRKRVWVRFHTQKSLGTIPHAKTSGYDSARKNVRVRFRTQKRQGTIPHAKESGYNSTRKRVWVRFRMQKSQGTRLTFRHTIPDAHYKTAHSWAFPASGFPFLNTWSDQKQRRGRPDQKQRRGRPGNKANKTDLEYQHLTYLGLRSDDHRCFQNQSDMVQYQFFALNWLLVERGTCSATSPMWKMPVQS